MGCMDVVSSPVFCYHCDSKMGLYDVPMFMSLFGFGMMFARFHI